jgi:hypothetical protein
MLNTRELIARRLFVAKVKDGYLRHEARVMVFYKTGIVIPYTEAKKT